MEFDLNLIIEKNKKIITYAIVVIILFVIGAIFFNVQNLKKQEKKSSNEPSENQPTAASESENPAAAPETGKTPPQSSGTTTLSYNEAVNLYKDRRIQFTEDCQVVPNYVTFKNGTKVMFDNRASKKRTINLAGEAYYFEPYDFKILTLSARTLPFTIMIDCGTGRNNGRILLQQ